VQRYTQAKKKQFVLEFHRAGQSAAAFCRRHHISPVTLAAWRRRYPAAASSPHPATEAAPADSPGLPVQSWLSVTVIPQEEVPPSKSVVAGPYVLSCGARSLTVPVGFDAREVRQLWELIHFAQPRP
jgi:transposase-like protein